MVIEILITYFKWLLKKVIKNLSYQHFNNTSTKKHKFEINRNYKQTEFKVHSHNFYLIDNQSILLFVSESNSLCHNTPVLWAKK